MTSKLHKRLQTFLACAGIAILVTFIILLWMYVGHTPQQSTFNRSHQNNIPPNLSNLNISLINNDAAVLTNSRHKGINNQEDAKSNGPPSHVLGYVQNLDTELVRLEKISPPPLQGHDTIFDQQLNSRPSLVVHEKEAVNISSGSSENATNSDVHHHHSGHFRHLHTEIWDPHPQYIIKAFGQELHLILRHNAKFLRIHGFAGPIGTDGRIEITHVFRNHTKKVKAQSRPAGCFYTGKVKGDPESDVAVSLCGGMTGYIRSKDGNFYIEPAEFYDNSSVQQSVLHRVHKISSSITGNVTQKLAKNLDGPGPACDTDTNSDSSKLIFDDIIDESFQNDDENFDKPHDINKRDTWTKHYPTGAYSTTPLYSSTGSSATFQSKNREYFIETLVVADKKMAEYHQTDDQLTHYILTLMSHVSLLYKDATIGNPISISVVKIMVLHEHEFVEPKKSKFGHVDGVNSGDMLKEFCKFQHIHNGEERTPEHHDIALLLTRETICRNTKIGQCDSETLGLAELGSMCSPTSSCAIIKDKGLPTSYTIAHELGHVLSMPHDDDLEKCGRFNTQQSDVKYIMGHVIRNDTLPWLWSQCSKRYLTNFLETNRAKCLYDLPDFNLILNASRNLPGQTFDADKQCELMFGNGIKLCTYMPRCRHLWCEMDPKKDEGCTTLYQPWADGTPCGRDRWCHRGACVASDPQILTPVAGGWGRWQSWGVCSRTCGGGIQRAERECDSPSPQNGGPYCIGPSVRYGSCNTEPCEENAMDFREKQCAAFNGNTRGIYGLKQNVKWVPKYGGIEPEEMCILYCRVQNTNQHYLLAERVVDGTKCGLNNFDICVNGACRKGGCDNRLDSNLTLDACGVCGGNGSLCEQISGSYNFEPTYGYSKVVRIPRGSSNLDIRQHGYGGTSRDGNYLALVDSETGKYVLNGDNHVSSFTKVFMYGGVTLEYTGTNAVIERINSSGSARLKKDLVVELLSVDRLLRPNITYEYMIVRGNGPRYSWQLYKDEWAPCSRICSGVRKAIPRCLEISTNRILDDTFCEHLDRDIITGSSTQQECNTHCRLAWKVKERHACSSHCGRGVRKLVHQCVKIDNTQQYQYLQQQNYQIVHDKDRGAQHLHLLTFDEFQDQENLSEVGDLPWAQAVDDNHCSDIEKPSDLEACEGPCDDTHWHYEDWSECTKSCGGGIQSRNSICVDKYLNQLDISSCLDKPRFHQQTCNTQKCPTWSVDSEWTPCSVTCGRGYRTKPYHCQVDGRVLLPEACDASTVPLLKESCEGERRFCTHWVADNWYPITCPCHVHIQKRSVSCRPLDFRPETTSFSSKFSDIQALDDSHCADMLKPNETRPCPRNDDDYDECIAPMNDIEDNSILPAEIFEWRSGPWSDCSRSCGGGSKSRNVACQGKAGTQREDRCDPNFKPISRVQCETQPCPNWNHGDWSSCNPDCHRYRLVKCQDSSGSTLSDERCSLTDRPANESFCTENINCHKKYYNNNYATTTSTSYEVSTLNSNKLTTESVNKNNQYFISRKTTTESNNYNVNNNISPNLNIRNFKWKFSEWSPCSKSCGRGFKTRHISCIDVDRNVTLVDQFCRHLKKPKVKRNCYRSDCTYVWQEGPWTECTQSCGEGKRYRNVTCHRVLGHGRSLHPEAVSAGRHTCDPQTIPSSSEKCLVRYCNESYTWVAGPWKECSHPCGPKGRQIRHLYCHHFNKKVPKKFCLKNLKPQRKQKCNQKRCTTFRSCLEIKRSTRSVENREYEILISNIHSRNRNRRFNIKIYCHGMNTPNPKEYISLPNEGRDNYAEIYDKRLIDAEVCPYHGQRNDNCDCIPSDSGIAGLTVFHKVRLNVTNMRIIGDDYTFSRQNSGTRVAYGTAGDCYSRVKNCPQGRFSINLTGTGLKISSRVQWIQSGILSSKTINRAHTTAISGKCGGYCGKCEPDPNIGLLVEPDVT